MWKTYVLTVTVLKDHWNIHTYLKLIAVANKKCRETRNLVFAILKIENI